MLLAPRLDILLAHLFSQDSVLSQLLEDRIYRASIPQDEREYPSLTFAIGTAVAVEGRTDQLDIAVTVTLTGEDNDAEPLIVPGDRADYLVRTLGGEVGGVRYGFLRKDGELDFAEFGTTGVFSHVAGQYTIRAEEPTPLLAVTT